MKNEVDKKIAEIENAVTFKKVMRGFDPEEVIAYIDEMSKTMQEASKNYELRMAEMKQELTFANRERDTLRARCEELEHSSAPAPAPTPVPEPEAVPEKPKRGKSQQDQIESLQKQLEEERALNISAADAVQNINAQIDALSAQLQDKEAQLASCYERIDLLEEQNGKQQSMRENYEDALAQLEKMKADSMAYKEQIDVFTAEAKATEAHLQKTETENVNLKTELGRVNIENSLLEEKNEQYKKEIFEMKAEAKEKAYENAEKLAAGEDALQQEKMKLQKQIQLQNYHIEQAGAAVEELKKQLEQIRISFE